VPDVVDSADCEMDVVPVAAEPVVADSDDCVEPVAGGPVVADRELC
jgi:hypothetical protein